VFPIISLVLVLNHQIDEWWNQKIREKAERNFEKSSREIVFMILRSNAKLKNETQKYM